MESSEPKSNPYSIIGSGDLQEINLSADETYLTIQINVNRGIDFSKEMLIIGLDTYDRSKGNAKYSNDISVLAPSGLEFEIVIKGNDDAQLLVQPDYNTANNAYSSVESSTGDFEQMITLINGERTTRAGTVIAAVYANQSKLNFGNLENNSYNNWTIENNQITIRIPWTRINFTDPSTMRVLDDKTSNTSPGIDELNTKISEGILVSGLLIDQVSQRAISIIGTKYDKPFSWTTWDIPDYQARLKDSYYIIQNYLSTFD